MIVCAIILFLVVAVNISLGSKEYFGLAFYTGLGILLIYLKVTVKERRKKRIVRSAKKRFSDSTFIAQVIQDFQARNWDDLNWKSNGCEIHGDRIVTPYQTYLYSSCGLRNLDHEGFKLLAIYLGEAYGGDYEMTPIEKIVGYHHTGIYSGYVGTDGDIHMSDISDGSEYVVGYKLHSKSSVPPPAPKGRMW